MITETETIQENKKAKIELKKPPVFKIINKNPKIDTNPAESDYLKFKVGDYLVRRYGSRNVIYKVLEINRLLHTNESVFKKWRNSNERTVYNPSTKKNEIYFADKEIKRLIDHYQSNNNSGVCEIIVKCVYRKNKFIKKGQRVGHLEFDISAPLSTYRSLMKVNFNDLLKVQDNYISNCQDQIISINNSITEAVKIKSDLASLAQMANSAATTA